MRKKPVKNKKRNPKLLERFDTGTLAKDLFCTLVADFRRQGFLVSDNPITFLQENRMKEFRDWEYIEGMNLPPLYFKMARQLNNLLSKYTFSNDAIDSKLRRQSTVAGWLDDAARIAAPTQYDYFTVCVLHEARAIVKSILGDLPDFDTIASFAKFGTRATRCCSRAHAGLDTYVSDPAAFSSSGQCLQWVRDVLLPRDVLLSNLLSRIITPDTEGVESIVLTLVPKKWSKDRPITPLQLVDLLYSYAWGKYVEVRLALAGLDIARLQDRHRKIVRRQSVQLTMATADMSGGSNNITKQNLLMLLSRDWYTAIKRCLTHEVIVQNEKPCAVWTPSVLPMGNALTFPLETLVFYSVTEAIRNLLGCKGFVSCYGDDLIYPARIHRGVTHVFKKLNWALNLTKTFVAYPFRESCGEDYYRGIAVRPFFFPDERPSVGKMAFKRLLYQVYNGLLERWSKTDISGTLKYLLVRIAHLGEIYRVPPDYPEYAGIKTDRPWAKTDPSIPFSKIRIEWCPDIQNFRFTFACLGETAIFRQAKTAVPFYWDSLRQSIETETLNTLKGKPAFDPLTYLTHAEKSTLKWKGFKRKVKKHGRVVREYTVWKLYVPLKKTRTTDDYAQTYHWSEVDAWYGHAGYVPAATPAI